MYFYPFNPVIILAIVVVIVIVALFRWGYDSILYYLWGRHAQRKDEKRFENEYFDQKVTFPVAGVDDEITNPDPELEKLIDEERFFEARQHIGAMKKIASEYRDMVSRKNYEAYERMLTRLQGKVRQS